MSSGLEDFSLFDLFRMEAEEQVRVLQQGLIELEAGSATAATLESLMRAAHSIKGAARIVGLDTIVNLTHVVEDRFVSAQRGSPLSSAEVDKMLKATDWLARLQAVPEGETAAWFQANVPSVNGREVPVVQLGELLGVSSHPLPEGELPVLICSGAGGAMAFAVDRLVDEVELPVRRLDARLGKVPGVSAASLDENGLPVLILDVEDLLQTAQGRPASTGYADGDFTAPHVLVVDDSHTVREMERRLLVQAGYRVTTAQNGQEAWNLLRLNDYDLLVSDVDMPQMNGIELVTKVRDNPRLGRMPVIILSYKDREEDRQRGLDAGADFYLTKGDFQNENFRQAVVDLIGTADGEA